MILKLTTVFIIQPKFPFLAYFAKQLNEGVHNTEKVSLKLQCKHFSTSRHGLQECLCGFDMVVKFMDDLHIDRRVLITAEFLVFGPDWACQSGPIAMTWCRAASTSVHTTRTKGVWFLYIY